MPLRNFVGKLSLRKLQAVSGGLNESTKPALIILFQNIVGFSQLDKMKDLRKCFTPETSAAVQLGAG